MPIPTNEFLAVMDREEVLLTEDNWHASAAVMREACERVRHYRQALRGLASGGMSAEAMKAAAREALDAFDR